MRPPPAAIAWWAIGMGTLLVTAALIWTMRERVESLIARLYDAARTNPLTKLLNRRGFRESLDLELGRARRSELAMTVLVGDIDHLDLAGAVDLRFSGSARHSETVGRYAEMMARELGLSDQHTGRVRLAGLLHDIGKVGVPDSILNKPGTLTAEEFTTIRTHPALGAQILEHPCLADVRAWVSIHHGRPDGQGYPLGLSGPELGIEARILAVADAYEAMTSDRAYRSSIGQAAAHAELRRCADAQFDSGVVDALLEVLDRDSADAGLVRVAA